VRNHPAEFRKRVGDYRFFFDLERDDTHWEIGARSLRFTGGRSMFCRDRSWRNVATRYGRERPNRCGLDADAVVCCSRSTSPGAPDLSPLRAWGCTSSGRSQDQWAMTVNGPWRICFEFRKGDMRVEIVAIWG
jgi:proteic killer suppression protein